LFLRAWPNRIDRGPCGAGGRIIAEGALNQALAQILPTLRPDDGVLVMNGDSTLAAEFIAVATALHLYLVVLVTTLAVGHLQARPLWVGVGVVFLIERVVTVWSAGPRGRLLALPMVIELADELFLQAVFVRSLVDMALRREAQWGTASRLSTLALHRG
jgi:hypothetical protein